VWVTVFTPLLIMAFALVMERVEAPLTRKPVGQRAEHQQVVYIGQMRQARDRRAVVRPVRQLAGPKGQLRVG
jgi:hypothetical protein